MWTWITEMFSRPHSAAKDDVLSMHLAPHMFFGIVPKKNNANNTGITITGGTGSIAIGQATTVIGGESTAVGYTSLADYTGQTRWVPSYTGWISENTGLTPSVSTTGTITLGGTLTTSETTDILLKLYRRCGDLRLLCFLPANKAERKKLNDKMQNLIVFDLLLSVNAKKTIEEVWVVSERNQEIWDVYANHLISTKQDIQLRPHQFEMAHHMLKKYVTECSHVWHFIVRMDLNCMEQIGYYAANRGVCSRSIFGDVTLDKLLLSYIPLRALMTMTQCSSQTRLRIWLFLWQHPISGFVRHNDEVHIKF